MHSLSRNKLGSDGAAALAPGIVASGSLTKLDVSWNDMKTEGVKLLRNAVQKRKGFELIDHCNN